MPSSIMIGVILLSVLASCAHAQLVPVLCECALFNTAQLDTDLVPNPMPLEYYGGYFVTNDQCDRDPGTVTECMTVCQQEFARQGGLETDLCTRTNGQSPRCTGSQWCEALHNSGIKTVRAGDGVNSLYYRMIECEGTAFTDWQYAFREVSDPGLCCDNGQFYHCTDPCEEACEANNLCECGAFIGSQFNETLLEGTNPLPLQNIGTEWGPPGQIFCENWPGREFGHPCDGSCLFSSRFFKNNVALQDPYGRNAGLTTGDFYCQILKNRWADQWPEDGIGPEDIVTYARMPGCDKNDGTNDHLKWNTERRYTCHHQALCCDGEGKRYRCEGGY